LHIRVIRVYIEDITRRCEDMTFIFERWKHEKIKVISSSHRVMFCLLYRPKQKIVKFHALKQTGKSHVIDVFTIVKIWKISRCVFFSISLSLYHIIFYFTCYKFRKHNTAVRTPYSTMKTWHIKRNSIVQIGKSIAYKIKWILKNITAKFFPKLKSRDGFCYLFEVNVSEF
jgi:uncharacterized membrane protein